MKRTFVVGDIHGGLRALEDVLGQLEVGAMDRFIFLGDYVDGWSESAQVISYLIEFGESHDCIFIKGNHDQWCEDWLKTGQPDDLWLMHGGSATIESYAKLSEQSKNVHIRFLDSMADYHIDEGNRLFVHAGFTSMHGVKKEVYRSNFSWDRTLWEAALLMKYSRMNSSSIYYPPRFRHYSEIYIGHTPTTNYGQDTPIRAGNLWNIDTGAAFTGKLSVLEVESKSYWQSQTVAHLYPDEEGRN